MTTVWSYPWGLVSGDLEQTLAELVDRDIDTISLASHYHSIRTLDPQQDPAAFSSFPGGCYFDPGESFDGTPIEPHVNEVEGTDDPLGTVVEAATEQGLSVHAWMVCLHNTRLGTTYPEYRIESAFGQQHDHAFCPSHEEVQAYYEGIAHSLATYDIDAIGLESIGFPSAFHGHGDEFGHDKDQVFASTAEELLFSQCFCEACRQRADFDIDSAETVVRELCTEALEKATDTIPSLAVLLDEHPILQDLFEFRADVIESFVCRIDDASDGVDLTYYASAGLGRGPSDGWPAGVRLDRLTPYLDRVTALCYTGDPEVARQRVQAFNEVEGVEIDAAVSLDPDFVSSRAEWNELHEAVTEHLSGELLIYNQSLMTDEHLDWLTPSSVELSS